MIRAVNADLFFMTCTSRPCVHLRKLVGMCASLLHYLMLAPCTARVIHCRVSVPPAFHTDVTESNSYRSLFNIQNKLNLGTFTLLDFSQKPGYQQEMGKHENRNSVRCTGPPSMRGRVLDTGHSIPQRPLQWLNPNTRLVRQAVLDTIIPPLSVERRVPGEEREEGVTDTSKPPLNNFRSTPEDPGQTALY